MRKVEIRIITNCARVCNIYIRVVILHNLRENEPRVGSVCVCLPEVGAERNTKNVKVAKQCHQPLGTIDLTFPTVTSRSSNRSGSNVTKNRYACRMLATIQACRLCVSLYRIVWQDGNSLYLTFINQSIVSLCVAN